MLHLVVDTCCGVAREICGGEGIACCLTVDVEKFNAECHDDGLFYV